MAIMAKADADDGNFKKVPAGTHQAVCVDVVDLGMVTRKSQWGEKTQHQIRIVWQVPDEADPAKPFMVSRQYTLSLWEKANLFKDLESWRGKKFTEKELEGFDVETVITANALLTVVQESKNGKTYSNVKTVSALVKGTEKLTAIPGYTRVKDRKAESHQDAPPPAGDDEDGVPF